MQFKTKDLLVHVLPAGFAKKDLHCYFGTGICVTPSGPCGPCSFYVLVACKGSTLIPTRICFENSLYPFVIQNLEDLAALKAELQDTLKSLDAMQKEGLPSSIGSKSEAEVLERGLTEALKQVRAAKKKF